MKIFADSSSPERIANPTSSSMPEVLVIDDDPSFQKLLSKAFSPAIKVVTALSGRGGLEFISNPNHSFHCVLLDYHLPGADGLQVLRKLRALDAQIPIIFMTGFGDLDLAKNALQSGANEYFPKPAAAEELFDSISQWLPQEESRKRHFQRPSPETRTFEATGNRFSAIQQDGETIEGRIVRFGPQSVVVEMKQPSHELSGGGKSTLQEIEMELGKFSLSVESADLSRGAFFLNNTIEIPLPGPWHVESEAVSSSGKMPQNLSATVSDLELLLTEMNQDLDALELHIEDWDETEQASLAKSFIAQVEVDYFPAIDAAVAQFESVTSGLTEAQDTIFAPQIRDRLYPLVLASPFMSRVIEKPIGVPGDYGMLGQILGDPFEGHSLYSRTLNGWILKTRAAGAYRHRVDFLTQHLESIIKIANSDGRRAKILSIGSGVAYEVQRYINQFGETEADFQLLDFSTETLTEAHRLIDLCVADSNMSGLTIDIQQGSILDLIAKSRNGETEIQGGGEYDFVYCTGLFDYLSDRLCEKVTGYLCRLAKPGGKIAVSNYTPKNPIRRFMDLVLDWQLIYRNLEQFEAIIDRAAPQTNCYQVFEETGGVEVYGVIEKGL